MDDGGAPAAKAALSKEFLTITGQETSRDGDVYGQVRKGFAGLFVSTIAFKPEREGTLFHKK